MRKCCIFLMLLFASVMVQAKGNGMPGERARKARRGKGETEKAPRGTLFLGAVSGQPSAVSRQAFSRCATDRTPDRRRATSTGAWSWHRLRCLSAQGRPAGRQRSWSDRRGVR